VDFATRLFTAKGDLSSMRVVFVGVAVLVVAVPIMAWAIVYVVHDGLGDVPSGVVTLASLVFITVTGGKYLEKREELKTDVLKADSASRSGSGVHPDVGRPAGQES
jgi:hypothetical protein